MNYEKLPKTISAEELLSTPLPPAKWIIPDLLPAGLALFAGPSKAGKSWLTLWLCLQVAQGKPMWGREIEPHTVLYLSLEDTFNRLQKRLLRLVGSEEAPERLVMQTECSSIGQGLEEQLTSFLYQHPDTGLIVIDTLQKVRSSDQNNSMYASDYKEISALKALADKYNICILLIHHLRKQAADDPFQQIAGSNGLMGASDTSWVMQRKRMSQTASILVTGRDMDNKTLRLHEENCVWMLDEEESTEQIVAKAVPSYLWKVADYIDSVGTWQGTATELLSAADIEGVLPHQLTRKIVEHFDTVFTPRGIRYETHRTSQARQMKFSHDGNDADDANDADIDITQLFKWDISQTASSASLASQRSRKESKHSGHLWKTSDRHNLKSNCTSYSTLLPGHTRANHRPGCWKQLPLPVPHCWQYRRRLESIATVRIMIADPSLEVCLPRYLSQPIERSAADKAASWRQNSRDALAETLRELRQGQLYVAGDSDIRLSRCQGERGPILSLYTVYSQKGTKIREKICIFHIFFSALFVYPDNAGITYPCLHDLLN